MNHKQFLESLTRSMGSKKNIVNEVDMSNAATMAPNAQLPKGGVVGMKRTPKEQAMQDFQRIHSNMFQLYQTLRSTTVGRMPQLQQAWKTMNSAIEQAERTEMMKP